MNYTLLDLVQTILSSMDSDEVTSINDTAESQQVAKIVRTVYFDILERANLPEHYNLINLTSGTVSLPTVMTIPATVSDVLWVKYDKQTLSTPVVNLQPVKFKELNRFLQDSYALNPSDTTVQLMDITDGSNHVKVYVRKDKAPDWYTTYNDNSLIFDSYDAAVDTQFLQGSKTSCYGKMIQTFAIADGTVPALDEPQMALLLNEAKALAWAELRQAMHQKAEINAKRGWTILQKTKFKTEQQTRFDQLPNYGRK